MSRSTYEPPAVGRITFETRWESVENSQGRRRLVPATVIREVALAQASALPNPNPHRFEVRSVEALGRGLVVEVIYPDCTTYEGRKVLVFAHTREIDVRAATVLDPHFTDKAQEDALVPVARFEPTDRGWKLARICAAAL